MTHRTTARLAKLLALAIVPAGCASVLDLDAFSDGSPPPEGAGGESAASTSGGGELLSAGGHAVGGGVVSVPDGWSGPVVRVESDDAPAGSPCPRKAAPERIGYRDLVATGACAACGCEPECAPGGMLLDADTTTCAGGVGYAQKPQGGCTNIVAADYPSSVAIAPPATSCAVAGGESLFETPAWTWSVSLCAIVNDADAREEVCVWRTGEHDCPIGFTSRFVYHEGYLDDRSCSACSCATSVACVVETQFKVNVSCSGGTQTVANPTPCATLTQPHSFNTVIVSPGACVVDGEATMVGGAAPDPATALSVCCAS